MTRFSDLFSPILVEFALHLVAKLPKSGHSLPRLVLETVDEREMSFYGHLGNQMHGVGLQNAPEVNRDYQN